MFRLAHISDLHLHPLPDVRWYELANKRLTGYLNWKLHRKGTSSNANFDELLEHLKSNHPSHIAITGDLVNLALPKEIENAKTFLSRLSEPENCTVIGGNHDAYIPGAFAKCMKAWQPFMTGDNVQKIDFPYCRIRNDIALIACNSAEATLPFMATGYFRKDQAERLFSLLNETKGMCRVVLIHHPPIEGATPKYKRLIGLELFQEVIAESGAELVLHGHTHLATANKIAGPAKTQVPVICVPAAGASFSGHRPAGRYNLFEIENNGTNWQINWKAYGKPNPKAAVTLLEERML